MILKVSEFYPTSVLIGYYEAQNRCSSKKGVIIRNTKIVKPDGLLPFNYFLPLEASSNSIQVANVVIDHSVSPSIYCKKAASKARLMLFIVRRPLAELSVAAFAPIYSTLDRPHLEYDMQACSPNLVAFKVFLTIYPRPAVQGRQCTNCQSAICKWHEKRGSLYK